MEMAQAEMADAEMAEADMAAETMDTVDTMDCAPSSANTSPSPATLASSRGAYSERHMLFPQAGETEAPRRTWTPIGRKTFGDSTQRSDAVPRSFSPRFDSGQPMTRAHAERAKAVAERQAAARAAKQERHKHDSAIVAERTARMEKATLAANKAKLETARNLEMQRALVFDENHAIRAEMQLDHARRSQRSHEERQNGFYAQQHTRVKMVEEQRAAASQAVQDVHQARRSRQREQQSEWLKAAGQVAASEHATLSQRAQTAQSQRLRLAREVVLSKLALSKERATSARAVRMRTLEAQHEVFNERQQVRGLSLGHSPAPCISVATRKRPALPNRPRSTTNR